MSQTIPPVNKPLPPVETIAAWTEVVPDTTSLWETLQQFYTSLHVDRVIDFLNTYTLVGNSLSRIIVALLAGLFGFYFFPKIWTRIVDSISIATKKTTLPFDDLLSEQLRKIHPRLFLLIAILLSLKILIIPVGIYGLFSGAVFGLIAFQFAYILQPLIEPLIKSLPIFAKPDMKAITNRLITFFKTILWAIAGMFGLSSLGFSITPLLGSLGVLGIGGALAFQQMIPWAMKALGFHFSKPFSVWDKISAGNHQGIVDEIDITTTKLIKSDGSMVDVSNEELMNAIIIPTDGPHFLEETLKILVKLNNTPEVFTQFETIVAGAMNGIEDTTLTSVRFFDFRGSAVAVDITYSVLAEKKSHARHKVVEKLLVTFLEKQIFFSGIVEQK